MGTVIALPVETALGRVGPRVRIVACSCVLKNSVTVDKLLADRIRTYMLERHNDRVREHVILDHLLFRQQE